MDETKNLNNYIDMLLINNKKVSPKTFMQYNILDNIKRGYYMYIDSISNVLEMTFNFEDTQIIHHKYILDAFYKPYKNYSTYVIQFLIDNETDLVNNKHYHITIDYNHIDLNDLQSPVNYYFNLYGFEKLLHALTIDRFIYFDPKEIYTLMKTNLEYYKIYQLKMKYMNNVNFQTHISFILLLKKKRVYYIEYCTIYNYITRESILQNSKYIFIHMMVKNNDQLIEQLKINTCFEFLTDNSFILRVNISNTDIINIFNYYNYINETD
jgi:hypothetical protein